MLQRGFFHRSMRLLLTGLFLQAALGTSSGFSGAPHAWAVTQKSSDKDGEELLQGLVQIAPKGWTLKGDIKKFNPKTLWEHIDGRAEFFLSYEMMNMVFAHYADASNDDNFIDVSIYDMGNPANAFGVFAAERRDDFTPVDIGRRGYGLGAHIFIWQGAYYVRMIASRESPAFGRLNLNTAEKLMRLLQDRGDPLWGLQALPAEGLIPGSEQYFRRDALGLDFMADTYTARYRKRGVEVTVFLSQKEHPAAAGDILRRYGAYAKQFGEDVREVARSGVSILLCDMDGSFDALFQKGNILGGVTAVEDPADAVDFAHDLWQRLPARDKDNEGRPRT